MNAIEIEAIQFKVNRPNRISFNAIPLVVFLLSSEPVRSYEIGRLS